jgi:transcriptional regulator with XRE-family HTH domain
MPSKRLDPIDKVIGQNIHFHRVKKWMSQAELAHRVGITFQQIQKYENATNRVSASRLFRIARVLGVPPIEFFPGAQESEPHHGSAITLGSERHALRLTEAYSKIADAKRRRLVLELIELMAESAD